MELQATFAGCYQSRNAHTEEVHTSVRLHQTKMKLSKEHFEAKARMEVNHHKRMQATARQLSEAKLLQARDLERREENRDGWALDIQFVLSFAHCVLTTGGLNVCCGVGFHHAFESRLWLAAVTLLRVGEHGELSLHGAGLHFSDEGFHSAVAVGAAPSTKPTASTPL